MYEPAPLIGIPEAPVPLGAEADWVVGAGGGRLRAALFKPPGRARGSVVLSGGRTEPIEKYFETIQDFMDRGFVVLAHDWRGQGLSVRELPDRLKGHARGFKPFLDDFRRLLDTYEDRLPKPWIAVGHSMGGGLTLLALAHGEKRFVAAALSAPMLGVQFGGAAPVAARMLCRLNILIGRAGQYTLRRGPQADEDAFDGNILTHHHARFMRYRAQVAACPDLALGSPTWGWLDFALRATAELAKPERLRGVTIPVSIVQAGEERLVDNAAQAAAARNLPQGRLVPAPRAYHEILMETDDMRNIFLRAFDALTGKSAPKPAEPPKPSPSPAPVAAKAPEPAKPPPPAPTPAPTAATAAAPAVKKASTRKPAAKKPAAKKAPAKKPAAKPAAAKASATAKPAPKPAAKPAAAKAPAEAAAKPAAKKASAKAAPKPAAKPAAAKARVVKKAPAAKKAPAKKPAAKPVVAKPAPAAKAPAAKKPAAKKAPAKKAPAKKAPAKKPAAKKP